MNGTSGAKKLERMLERWGQKVRIVTEEGTDRESAADAKAFIQPLRYKNKMYLGGSFLPPGYADGGHYLYIGSARHRIDLAPFDTVIHTREESYTVKRAEKFCVADEILYVWAVLQRYEKE